MSRPSPDAGMSRSREPAAAPPDPAAFAREWYEAWNRHDLSAILDHYAEGVLFSSPFVASLGADPSGQLSGKAALRAYWSQALARFPELRFTPLHLAVGVNSLVLTYRGVGGVVASEAMEFDCEGRVCRAAAHYERAPEEARRARAGAACCRVTCQATS